MISQLASNLDNAYRVDLNHTGDYRFDLESEALESDWCRVELDTPKMAQSLHFPNASSNGNNAGYCATFRMRTKV